MSGATIGSGSTVHAVLGNDDGSIYGTECGVEGPKGGGRLAPADGPVTCGRCLRYLDQV